MNKAERKAARAVRIAEMDVACRCAEGRTEEEATVLMRQTLLGIKG